MERLTQHTPNGASLILDNPSNAEEARQQVTAKFMLACNRLAAYEDTGLMPDEVALYVKCQAQSVSRRELQLGREIERLHAQLAEAQKREQAQRWIPVTERLPQRSRAILAYSPPTPGVTDLYEVTRGFMAQLGKRTSITHWMPLPELPKEA